MKIIRFDYAEDKWKLEGLDFTDLSLLVAKNSIGKSRTINALAFAISNISTQKQLFRLFPYSPASYKCKFSFSDEGKTIEYQFEFKNKEVVKEVFIIDNEKLLNRSAKKCVLNGEKIVPPQDQLVIKARRDIEKYPSFEKVLGWADNSGMIAFNELETNPITRRPELTTDFAKVFEVIKPREKELLKSINELGYKVKRINAKKVGENWTVPAFYEEGVGDLTFYDASNGMCRTIYLLILLYYHSLNGSQSLLMIDDLCEGLDYDRSMSLAEKVKKFCYENGIQLLCSSNDSFLMDIIPLENWVVLQREKSKVSCLTYNNSRDLFEKFKYTGLSNFDFFSSDFIQNNKEA